MDCLRVVARCLHLFASDFRRWEKYIHAAAPMVLLPSQSLQLTRNEFPIRDTFLSCAAVFPFAFPFPFLFFHDTTCQPVRSMMIHGPFVILSNFCGLPQTACLWKWSTRFSSLQCQIFHPSLLVFDFGPRSANGPKAENEVIDLSSYSETLKFFQLSLVSFPRLLVCRVPTVP